MPPAAAPSPSPDASPTPANAPATASPTEPPQTPAPPPPPRNAQVEAPAVTVRQQAFPISAQQASIVLATPSEHAANSATFSVNEYLQRLDHHRSTGAAIDESLFRPGRFRDAVLRGIAGSAREGVQRKFELVSLRVDRVYEKPWGTQALMEVTVTIADRVVSGSGADELETGRLRLGGDRRMTVIDAWDAATGRWFDGLAPAAAERIFTEAQHAFGWYLVPEMWLPDTPVQTFHGPGGETPYSRARNALIAALDRQRITSRTLANVTATIERFDRLTEMGDGIATVRLAGTVITKSASGAEERAPFTRLVRAFRQTWGTGNGWLTVIDEQGPGGAWLSGGDLALKDIDRTFG